MLAHPLFVGPPGGIKLLFAFLLSTLVPLVVVALVVYYLRSIDRRLSRLVELQER